MRIVTRPDFDGVVCAVLLKNVLDIDEPIIWAEPSDIQRKLINIYDGDVIANLPYNNKCSLWFDHHYSNKTDRFFGGAFEIAPSAAGVVYKHYEGKFNNNFDELIKQVDKIDSASLTLDEILYPEKYQYILLSMTIIGHNLDDEPYWNYLVNGLGSRSIKDLMNEPDIINRCQSVIKNNIKYCKELTSNTYCIEHISISDFRGLSPRPTGNRFLVHSLFPKCTVNIKIFFEGALTVIAGSKNILKEGCLVNLGKMFAVYEGGGHDGAGACSFPNVKADKILRKIIGILLANK